MNARHKGEDWFDGLDASLEFDRGDSGAAKANFRASTSALVVLVLGAAVILSKGDPLERLLDAAPGLAERLGDRLPAVG